ncbi:MAG: major outer membrane protein [Arcobacteraceae bacterium]|nr:major outer membrane protein [Arcobacteraceae bacterium]
MKKFVKMSLVAAVAVAGLTTTSSAAALSESIKNTDLSGYLRLRVNTTEGTATTGSEEANEAKAVLNFKSKVNDSVTANIKIVAAGGTKADTLNLNQANFIMTGPVTAIVGRQTAQSPFVANNGDTVATGVTALVPAGPVTIAAAHYTDATSVSAADDAARVQVSALALIAKAGPVNLELWGAKSQGDQLGTNTSDASGDIDYTAILASTNIGPVTLSAHWAEKDTGVAGTEYENAQVVVSGKAGIVSLFAAYAETGITSGDVTIDNDTDSKLIYALETINTTLANVEAVVVGASVPAGPVTLGVTYLDADYATTGTGDETKFTVSYPMSKNFTLSAWYSSAETKDSSAATAVDTDKSRIEAIYSF